jgi:hypothetical protein
MTLEKYLGDREIWQNNTIEEIKKKVIYKPTSLKNNRRGEKLVAIYGPPQIGKTTLILCLLGIAPEYQKKVYNDIRAGVPRGNSSTSTAIIYQQIDSDLYGVKYGESDGSVELCTDAELQEKIREVRKKVEDDSASKDILHIYIPQKYFTKIVINESGLNIVDLPGDGSRNVKEKSHVDAMINKYMALATVNIIACKANEIQSLETLQLPINVDWKNLPHKYIVVITNSYGLGTIRKFFKTKRKRRKVDFYEFVSQSYERDVKEIIGNLSKIEVFPIDIGDSYEKVLYSCGLDEYDQSSVITARNKVLEEIRESIHQRQGNSLKSTMLDLKAYTTDYAKNQCDDLQEQLNELFDEKDALKKDNDKEEKRISECVVKIAELESCHSRYVTLCQYIVKINAKPVIESVEETILHYSKKGKIKDSNHTLVGEFRDILISLIRNEFSGYFLSNDKTEHEALYEKINMNIDFEATIGDKLYKGGFFSKSAKQEDFVDLMIDLIEGFIAQLSNEIVERIDFQKRSIKDTCDDYLRYKQWKTESERDITNNIERITSIDTEIEVLKEKIEAIEERREADKKIIDDYLRIADKEFAKYKNDLLETLDSDRLSAEEKVVLLIYLCLIEKDFQSISEMG